MSKILVIEDEAAIRRVLVKILNEENDKYEIQEAENGASGMDMLRKSDYDLVLCD
ncbi:MAG: response regulator, partial [Bacteroidetes bacterium]